MMDNRTRPSLSCSRPAYMDRLFNTAPRRNSMQIQRPRTPVELASPSQADSVCSSPQSTRSFGSWKSTTSLDMPSTPPSTPPQTPTSEKDMLFSSRPVDSESNPSRKTGLSPRFKKLGNIFKRHSHPQVQETTATDFSNWCAAAAENALRKSQLLEAQRLQRLSQASHTSSSTAMTSSSSVSSSSSSPSTSSSGNSIQRASSMTTQSQAQRPTFTRCASACSTQAPKLDLPKLQTSFTPILAPSAVIESTGVKKPTHGRRNSSLYASRPLPALPPASSSDSSRPSSRPASPSSRPASPTSTSNKTTPKAQRCSGKKSSLTAPVPAKDLQCRQCYYFLARNCNGYVMGGAHGDACETCAKAGFFGSP